MSAGRLNTLLAAAFVASFALMWASRRDVHQPNVEFLPDMAHAPRYSAFAPNPVLRGGSTLQPPPPGTIARDVRPLRYAATPADAVRAGDELTSPFRPEDEAARARGEEVYRTFCVPCHGAGGSGDGPAAKMGVPPPPSLLAEHARALKDGQLFHILTYGQANMASYAAQLSREDRWRVILYVRWLQASAPTTPSPAPGPPQ
ncbi:MAG: c-type cytochrome [Acidobacteriota bacterium]